MKVKDIDLNADDLIQALTDVRDHVSGRRKVTMRTTKVALPKPVEDIRPEEVREIREKLNLSQAVFSRLLNVPVVTEASWEAGRRNPSGAALRLLQIAKNEPEMLLAESPLLYGTLVARFHDWTGHRISRGLFLLPPEFY